MNKRFDHNAVLSGQRQNEATRLTKTLFFECYIIPIGKKRANPPLREPLNLIQDLPRIRTRQHSFYLILVNLETMPQRPYPFNMPGRGVPTRGGMFDKDIKAPHRRNSLCEGSHHSSAHRSATSERSPKYIDPRFPEMQTPAYADSTASRRVPKPVVDPQSQHRPFPTYPRPTPAHTVPHHVDPRPMEIQVPTHLRPIPLHKVPEHLDPRLTQIPVPNYLRPTPSHISSRNGKAPERPVLESPRRASSQAPQVYEKASKSGSRPSSRIGAPIPQRSRPIDPFEIPYQGPGSVHPFGVGRPIGEPFLSYPAGYETKEHPPPSRKGSRKGSMASGVIHPPRAGRPVEEPFPYPPVGYETKEYTPPSSQRGSRRGSIASRSAHPSRALVPTRSTPGDSKFEDPITPWDSISEAPTRYESELPSSQTLIQRRASVSGGKPKLAFVRSKGEKGRYPGLRLNFIIDIGLGGIKRIK